MATAASSLLLPTETVVVQLPLEKSISDQRNEEVGAEYHVECATPHPEETPIVMPNYIEIV